MTATVVVSGGSTGTVIVQGTGLQGPAGGPDYGSLTVTAPKFKAHDTTAPSTAGEDLTLEGGAGTLVDEVGTLKWGAFRVRANGFCLGYDSTTFVSGAHAIAVGYDATAIATYAIAIGGHCHATAAGAVAIGESCSASAANAVAIGWNNTSTAYSSVATGMYLSALAEGSFVCGVSATSRLPGEFTHGSGIAAKVGFSNIGHREIDVGVRANAAPANCKMRDTLAGSGTELTLQEYCLSSIRVRVTGGTTAFGKVASEEAVLLVKTTSGSVSTIIGSVTWTTIGQTFVSQGWSVAITVTGKTLRITGNPGTDDVEFFARVDIMDQAL